MSPRAPLAERRGDKGDAGPFFGTLSDTWPMWAGHII